jgi:hypothetical protein
VICICTEQTVTQTSATEEGFGQAFLTALDAYVKSTVRDEVNRAIKVLLEGGDGSVDFIEKGLEDIIKNHRLRMQLLFGCQ